MRVPVSTPPDRDAMSSGSWHGGLILLRGRCGQPATVSKQTMLWFIGLSPVVSQTHHPFTLGPGPSIGILICHTNRRTAVCRFVSGVRCADPVEWCADVCQPGGGATEPHTSLGRSNYCESTIVTVLPALRSRRTGTTAAGQEDPRHAAVSRSSSCCRRLSMSEGTADS